MTFTQLDANGIATCGTSSIWLSELPLKTGGFIAIRHNERLDVTADLLSVGCKDFSKEPVLISIPTCNDTL